MKTSQTYDYEKNDHFNRASMALVCSTCLGIKEISPSLYKIAAPVSEIAYLNKDGGVIRHRCEILDAIPWDERSMKTFGAVYSYEATASFIGRDGKTYIVPNDKPVLDHLKECGYLIAPYGANLDGKYNGEDSLIFHDKTNWDESLPAMFQEKVIIDMNLPKDIVEKILQMETDRPYYTNCQPYNDAICFGGSFGLNYASAEELKKLSLSERKLANIKTYGRVRHSENIEDYVERVVQEYYLNPENFPSESDFVL